MCSRFVHDSGKYAELDTGSTKLALAEHGLAAGVLGAPYAAVAPDRPPPGLEIGLGVDDARAAFARATKAGATAVKKPTKMSWGQTVAYVRDPDGFLFVLVQGD